VFDSTLMMGGEMFPVEQSRRAALAPIVRYHLPFAALVLHCASLLCIILLHEKFVQFDWLRAVVFQLNLKYLNVKITNPWQVVV